MTQVKMPPPWSTVLPSGLLGLLMAVQLYGQEVQLGPNGPVVIQSQPDSEEDQKPETIRTKRSGPRVSTIHMRPAAEPSPALQHVFVPEYLDVKPGNAAQYYYRAIMRYNNLGKDAIQDMQDLTELPPSELDTDKADKVLQVFDSVLSEVEIAVHREHCDWDWRLRDRSGKEQIQFLLEEIQVMRSFARIISLKVGNHIAKREFDEATRGLMMGYRMAEDVGKPAILVNDLVGIAIASVMNRRTLEFIDTPDSPNLYWAIASLPRPLVSMRDGFQHERALPYRFFPFLREPEKANLTKEQWRRVFDEQFSGFVESVWNDGGDNSVLESPAAVAAATYPRAKQELIAQGFPKEKVDAMAVAQVIAIHESRVLRRISDDLFKWSFLPYHEADGWIEKVEIQSFDAFAENGESLPIATLLLPALTAAARAEVRLQTDLDGLRAVEAIRMQMAKGDGQIPAALEDVQSVPVPINPSTNRPFVYRPMATGNGRVLELIPGKNPAKSTMWQLELVLPQNNAN